MKNFEKLSSEELAQAEKDAFSRYYRIATIPCTQQDLGKAALKNFEYERSVFELEKIRSEIERRACQCGTE